MTEQPYNHLALLMALLKDKPEEAAHFEALGRFLAAYAQAEAQIHMCARWLSKMDDTRARVVFGGMRLTDSIERIRALLKIAVAPTNGLLSNPDMTANDASLIAMAIEQFEVITATRHKLIHRTVRMEEAGLQVSNIFTVKNLLHAEPNLIVTLKDLRAMQTDCGAVYLQLSAVMEDPEKAPSGEGSDLSRWRVPLAWQYKPSPPAPPKTPRQKGPKGPKPPPPSSGK